MATMNISLPSDMVEFVEHEVSQGGYASSSEVVKEALRLLRHEKGPAGGETRHPSARNQYRGGSRQRRATRRKASVTFSMR
ncbi:ribbon-helix-helix domain-containing protein [Mesorhizobium sp. BHbdii]